MKALELHQIEQIEGGWSWDKCVEGVGHSIASGFALTAAQTGALAGGGVGLLAGTLGAFAIGCVAAQ